MTWAQAFATVGWLAFVAFVLWLFAPYVVIAIGGFVGLLVTVIVVGLILDALS